MTGRRAAGLSGLLSIVCAVPAVPAVPAGLAAAASAPAAAASATRPSTQAASCAASLGPGSRQVDAADISLAWLPLPQPIPRDTHFAVLLRLCADTGWSITRVDADMPAHRHGMNYKASLQRLGPQLWRAEGLMFHMSGRWRLLVDVTAQGQPGLPGQQRQEQQERRLSDEVELK